MKSNHFDTLVWNELRKDIIIDVGDIREDLKLFEKLKYSKGSILEMLGTEMIRYTEYQLYVRFRNTITLPPHAGYNRALMNNLDFFSQFLMMFVMKMNHYEILRNSNYGAIYKRHN
jgi:hypothetical protein